MRRRSAFVCEPMCDVTITFSILSSGWSLGNGSGIVTSRAAAAMLPDLSASTRSCCTTMSPRAIFTNVAELFIIRNWSAPIMLRVSGDEATQRTTKSLRFSSSDRPPAHHVTPNSVSSASLRVRFQYKTSMLKPRMYTTSSCAIAPKPTSPKVAPVTRVPYQYGLNEVVVGAPACRTEGTRLRALAKISAAPSSAVGADAAPGVKPSGTPRSHR
mmetsp:Transcript_118772/g.236589  ORF Transcript_118772/g.236589 Transcript_118772/m.236589 type:complete len:214 (+) Transcript_118772:174-815(+)